MKKILGGFLMHATHELEDFAPGMTVLTPSGRRAVVIKTFKGESRNDLHDRVLCHYEGGGVKDMVTLQPRQLRIVAPPRAFPEQMGFAFG